VGAGLAGCNGSEDDTTLQNSTGGRLRESHTPFGGGVEDTGSEVTGFKAGDLVVAPFVWSDGTYESCCEGLQTFLPTRRHVGPRRYRRGQGEAVRVPQAQDTVVKLVESTFVVCEAVTT